MPQFVDEDVAKRITTVRDRLKRMRTRIGIHSGKGGVGKTTVAINIAALLAERLNVALFDADIDCPNVAESLGIRGVRVKIAGGVVEPVVKYGMKIMSTSFMSDSDMPLIIRGPMKHSALMQMLEMTDFGSVDTMIIDLPPGTSDVPLTVMQSFDLSGIVVVTTPQRVAAADARKSILMAQRMGITVLGVVENMSGDIFGTGTGKKLAEEMQCMFLGTIPMDKKISEACDKGMPAVLHDSTARREFSGILEKLGGWFEWK